MRRVLVWIAVGILGAEIPFMFAGLCFGWPLGYAVLALTLEALALAVFFAGNGVDVVVDACKKWCET